MNAEIGHLWNKIDNYPDKEMDILNIFDDAELAFLSAIDDTNDEKKLEIYNDKLSQIQELMAKTPFFDYDIYELHEWIQELKTNTFWRDKIEIDNKKIQRTEIKKWCHRTYNTLRYFLLSTGVVDLGIGASGKQPGDVKE